MDRTNNEVLQHLSTVWAWEGDWMKCRYCKRALVASRDGEPMIHKPECRYADQQHPWADLRKALKP